MTTYFWKYVEAIAFEQRKFRIKYFLEVLPNFWDFSHTVIYFISVPGKQMSRGSKWDVSRGLIPWRMTPRPKTSSMYMYNVRSVCHCITLYKMPIQFFFIRHLAEDGWDSIPRNLENLFPEWNNHGHNYPPRTNYISLFFLFLPLWSVGHIRNVLVLWLTSVS